MPPGSKPTSSHSSRPSARRSGSSHRSSHSSHRSSYHRSHHSGHSRLSGGGLILGSLLRSLFSQRSDVQERGPAVMNQQAVNPPPAPVMYECPYCRGKVTAQPSPDGRNLLTCPNCGGILAESNAIVQPQQTAQSFSQPQGNMAAPDTGYAEQPAARRKRSSPLVKVLFLVFMICIIAAAVRIVPIRVIQCFLLIFSTPFRSGGQAFGASLLRVRSRTGT